MHILAVILSFLSFVICLVLTRLWKSKQNFYRLGDQIPGPKPLPILGNLQFFFGDFTKKLQIFSTDSVTYGSTFRMYLGPYLVVFISNSNDIDSILSSTKFNTRNEFFLRGAKSYIGEGLTANSGEVWKRHRKIINPTFNYKVLESFMSIFNHNSQNLVKKLESYTKNSTCDVYKLVWLSSFNSVNETVMGVSHNAQNNNEIVWAMTRGLEIIMERISKPWLYINWIFHMTKLGKEHRDIIKTRDAMLDRIIYRKLEEHQTRNARKPPEEERLHKTRKLPFLELMITASETEGDLLSPLELRDEMLTLAVGGVETTSLTICFALVLLSLYPEHQEQVVEELRAVFGDDPARSVTTSDLNQLKYLDRVIKETMRLYPSVPLSPRDITEDVKLSSFTLPAGTVAVVNYYLMMRDPELFPDPLKFDPDRFLPEAVAQRPSNSYLPFGAGPRMCIGFRYAMMQMKTVMAHVLRRYEVLPACTREDLEDVALLFFLRPTTEFKLRLELRDFT